MYDSKKQFTDAVSTPLPPPEVSEILTPDSEEVTAVRLYFRPATSLTKFSHKVSDYDRYRIYLRNARDAKNETDRKRFERFAQFFGERCNFTE